MDNLERTMNQQTQEKIIALIAEYSPEFAKSERRQYLLAYYKKAFRKQYLKSRRYVEDTIRQIWYFMECQDRTIEKGSLVDVVYLTGRIKELVQVLVKIQDQNYFRRMNMGGDITNEMIRRAKEYPFKELLGGYGIEIDRHNRCKCPVHEGKNVTSFMVKDNMGFCHSCKWSGDSIALLIKKDNLSFPEAVKRLQ